MKITSIGQCSVFYQGCTVSKISNSKILLFTDTGRKNNLGHKKVEKVNHTWSLSQKNQEKSSWTRVVTNFSSSQGK